VETDLDKFVKSKPVKMVRMECPANGNEDTNLFDCTKQSESVENDIKRQSVENEVKGERDAQLALKLSFTLPASCYATMAIRELLKTSTSVCTLLQFLLLPICLFNITF
jgi:tRNA pseudouridine13 synthase